MVRIFVIISIVVCSQAIVYSQARNSETLDAKQESIVAISAFTAKGDLPRLRQAFHEGLTAGLTINEIKEELVHLSAYCGFPRSLNGINAFSAVLNERQSKGITDVPGKPASKVADSNKYDTGKKVLESLTGRPEVWPKTGYAAFLPAIDTLLKEHLFNDIFTRGVLDHRQRELATVSALVTLGGVESQLAGHISICLNLGLTRKQLEQVLSIIKIKIGKDQSDAGTLVLDKVLSATR